MSEHIFDTFARRAVTGASRRGIVRALAGLTFGVPLSSLLNTADAEAKKKGKKKRKKKSKKSNDGVTSPPPPGVTCTRNCAGKVCGDDGCGGSCGTCGAGQLCAQGQCVLGQGTCATGDDICVNREHTCNPGAQDCFCWTSMSNQTRCGSMRPLLNSNEGYCSDDNQCAVLFPNAPGAFCVKSAGGNCTGQAAGYCYGPCTN
jgi:hypothetical protein